jgi:hypothetical protein
MDSNFEYQLARRKCRECSDPAAARDAIGQMEKFLTRAKEALKGISAHFETHRC